MEERNLLILETLQDAQYYIKNESTMPVPLKQLDIISTQPIIQAYLISQNSSR